MIRSLLVLSLVGIATLYSPAGAAAKTSAQIETAAPSGALTSRRPHPDLDPTSRVRHWNHIAIDASGLDHTPVADGENRVFGENLGPGRSSRAMAIVHIAVFE